MWLLRPEKSLWAKSALCIPKYVMCAQLVLFCPARNDTPLLHRSFFISQSKSGSNKGSHKIDQNRNQPLFWANVLLPFSLRQFSPAVVPQNFPRMMLSITCVTSSITFLSDHKILIMMRFISVFAEGASAANLLKALKTRSKKQKNKISRNWRTYKRITLLVWESASTLSNSIKTSNLPLLSHRILLCS